MLNEVVVGRCTGRWSASTIIGCIPLPSGSTNADSPVCDTSRRRALKCPCLRTKRRRLNTSQEELWSCQENVGSSNAGLHFCHTLLHYFCYTLATLSHHPIFEGGKTGAKNMAAADVPGFLEARDPDRR